MILKSFRRYRLRNKKVPLELTNFKNKQINYEMSYLFDWVSGQLPEWTPSQMDTIPNGTISNGYHPALPNPEWTQSRMNTIPMDTTRMNTIPNVHNPQWTRFRMDTIPIEHDPEWAQSQMDAFPNEHLHSYSSVVYVCLVRSFYKNAFNKTLVFFLNVSHL